MSKAITVVCCYGCGRDTKTASGYCSKCRTGVSRTPPATAKTEGMESDRPFSNYWEDMQIAAIYNAMGYEYEADEVEA